MKKFLLSLALSAAVAIPTYAQTQSDPTSNPASTEEKMQEKLSDESAKMRQKAANVQDNADAERSLPQSTLPVADRGNDVNSMDYERMVNSAFKIELRALVINVLGLTKEETEGFTPIYMEYMKYKNALVNRRTNLVEEFGLEMAEDDTVKDEENETADFIENYMEVDIAELELKKDYFDKLEDEIGSANALRFFEIEKMFQNRMTRTLVQKNVPALFMLIPENYTAYEREINDYRNWNKINITGTVGVDHNFTYNGLEKLLTAAEAMTGSEGIEVNNFADRKTMVMQKAAQLKKDWKSLNHADLAREAFTATAGILNDIANDSRFIVRAEWINKLKMQANAIKPSVKLTDQADEVRAFFSTAETIVNDLVDQANGANNK